MAGGELAGAERETASERSRQALHNTVRASHLILTVTGSLWMDLSSGATPPVFDVYYRNITPAAV